jgi:hypothetical protein
MDLVFPPKPGSRARAHIKGIVRPYGTDGAVVVTKEVSEQVQSNQSLGACVFSSIDDLQRIKDRLRKSCR